MYQIILFFNNINNFIAKINRYKDTLILRNRCPATTTQPTLLLIALPYARPLTLDDGGQACGLTAFKFCRRFQTENCIGFKQYLLNVRLQRTDELLAQTYLSIIDKAHQFGIGSQSHFTPSFRERRRMTPTAWRAKQRAAL